MSDGEAGERARTMLDAVGVSLTDSAGKILPLNEQLKNLSEGYKKAADAGYGQEFIMNTLGVRGMALTKTLQNYTEAAENAAKIKSIGIDPEEMHRISQQLKLVEMQAGQLKNVGGAVIAPIAADVFPPIIAGLAKTAQYVAENKKELKSLAKTGLEVVVVYKTMQAAAKISAGASAAWRAAQAAQMAQNVPQVDPAALTAAQEKSIARRMRNLDRLTDKEIRDMEKTVAKMAVSEEEKVRIATTSAMRIEQAAAQRAAQEQLYMTEMYRKTNLQAVQSAEVQIAAIQSVRTESAGAAAQLVGDHARAGAAAKAAGAQSVAAHEAGAAAARMHAGAAGMVAAAHGTVGTAAMGAGKATVTAMGTASRMVRSAAAAVFALAGGWLGVAVAIGYATYKLWEFNKEQKAEREKNTYEVNGQKYLERDGTFYTAAEQAADFGGIQGNVRVRVYQISETRGRGFVREEII